MDAPADAVWRLFIAIDLSSDIREACSRLQAAIRRTGAHVSCPEDAQLHITLCFLGHQFAGRVPDVQRVMDAATVNEAPFLLRVRGVGEFGRPGRPRVIWIGIDPAPALVEMQERLRQELTKLGFPLESRPFSPHITLARVKSGRGVPLLLDWRAGAREADLGELSVKEIRLYRSETNHPRPIYTVLHTAVLQAK